MAGLSAWCGLASEGELGCVPLLSIVSGGILLGEGGEIDIAGVGREMDKHIIPLSNTTDLSKVGAHEHQSQEHAQGVKKMRGRAFNKAGYRAYTEVVCIGRGGGEEKNEEEEEQEGEWIPVGRSVEDRTLRE